MRRGESENGSVGAAIVTQELVSTRPVSPPHLLTFSPSPTTDPLHRAQGEPLWPERYGVAELDRIKRQLGSYSFSALYQQRPTPLEGGLFKREWFKHAFVDRAPGGLLWCRGYDLAVSTKTDADYTASFRVALDENSGILYIDGGFRKRIEYPEQRKYVIERMLEEKDTSHGIEKALHGQAFVQDLQREVKLAHVSLAPVKAETDKLTRALPLAARAEDGKVALVRGPWNDEFIEEACSFPFGQHDDQIDAVSLAVKMLTKGKRGKGGF